MFKKVSIITLIIISMLFSISMPVIADVLYSGNCGDNVTYSVDEKYNLTVSGEGRMDDYENGIDDNIPWKEYRKNIQSITVQDGINYIGAFAFILNSNVNIINLPSTVSEFGTRAFMLCSSITDITIPPDVTTLPYGLFYSCTSLESIRLYNNIIDIGEKAFNDCTSLQTVYFYGTEDEWNNITIADGNDALLNANVVYIQEVQPASISISTKPIYIIGEDNALEAAVNLNYNDGTTTALSPDDYTLETDFDISTEGEYTIKATYGEFTNEIKVKVEPLKMVSLTTSLGSTYTPPQFIEGTELDLSDITVTVHYNNGTTEDITNYEVSGYDNTKIDLQVITISYGELSEKIFVEVVRKSIVGIRVASPPYKIAYYKDEMTLDTTGIEVENVYDNGTVDKNYAYTVSGFDGTKAGTQTITVTYGSFTDTFEVFVKIYEYKIDSNISRDYNFDTKEYTISTSITSRTDARPIKVIVAVYNDNGMLAGVQMSNEYFDTNAAKTVSVTLENIDYPYNTIKVFVWDYDLTKMMPMALSV